MKGKKPFNKKFSKPERKSRPISSNDDTLRLNRVLANAGYCSRREADVLIQTGLVSINGEICVEMGRKIAPDDVVVYNGETVKREQYRYLLLNKPKDFSTAENHRNSVFELVKSACRERLEPVGKMDRNTTGLLLFTNDGDLKERLTKPRSGFPKTYKVILDEPMRPTHLDTLKKGVKVEESMIKCEDAFFPDRSDQNIVVIVTNTSKHRIERTIFGALGFKVKTVDRIAYANIKKGDLNRGMARFLTEKEIGFLKMIH